MKLAGEKTLLRVYLRNTDKHGWFTPPAAEMLVARARNQDMAGATVLRGFFGLDVAGRVLECSNWSLVEHVPVIVEIVDEPQAIGRFLSVVEEVVLDGMATLERGHVLLYRHNRNPADRAAMRLAVPAPITPFSTLPSSEEFPVMKLSEDGQLLRVFIGEADTWQGEPLYRVIVMKVRELGMAGATVLRGPMGFGANSRVHTTKILELSTDLPIVIEIVDTGDKIQTLLPFLDEVVAEGMITIEAVRVLRYRHNEKKVRGDDSSHSHAPPEAQP
jgi:PII-like signaling protein